MAKRSADEAAHVASAEEAENLSEEPSSSGAKRTKLENLSEEELEVLVEERVRARLSHAAVLKPVPPALKETFTPNDPVHGLMHLPAIVKTVVDTMNFQRMRQIKQLGVCHLVYPGATHTRFFHSIGTAYLAYQQVKLLQQRQPELGVTDREVLCVMLAALCHDLGHPCYSHMFEVFLHSLGREKRRAAEADARQKGLPQIPEAEDAEIQRYERWNHEQASVMLLGLLFEELKEPLEQAGLRRDGEGDDFALVGELIDPPKKELEALMEKRQLREGWAGLIKGRPVQKAFLYEVVSNWRSGIDVDKFDYFRRDALFLGIQRQFDHDRYLKGVKVVQDQDGVPTVSPPEKDKDLLRESVMELRKMLHRAAYQHKTVKKIELHLIDILTMMDKQIELTGTGGKKMRMSEAAVDLDPVAYPKLTDTFVEARLFDGEDSALKPAHDEYQRRIARRELMRLVANWDLPRVGEGCGLMSKLPEPEAVIAGVVSHYEESVKTLQPEVPAREVSHDDFRCQVAKFHYGMGSRDPIDRVLFHNKDKDVNFVVKADIEAKPLRQKIFVFWNPVDKPSDELTLKRLTLAFTRYATALVYAMPPPSSMDGVIASQQAAASPTRRQPRAPAPESSRPRRQLRIQASCPVDDDMPPSTTRL